MYSDTCVSSLAGNFYHYWMQRCTGRTDFAVVLVFELLRWCFAVRDFGTFGICLNVLTLPTPNSSQDPRLQGRSKSNIDRGLLHQIFYSYIRLKLHQFILNRIFTFILCILCICEACFNYYFILKYRCTKDWL